MEWVETTGRSVQEAKDRALDELGVDEADAEFEVLAEAQTGLFGRLRSEARVRARVQPTAPRAKEDRRGRDRKRRAAEKTGSPAEPQGAPTGDDSPLTPAAARDLAGDGEGEGEGEGEGGGEGGGGGEGEGGGESASDPGAGDYEEQGAGRSGPRGGGGGGGGGGGAGAAGPAGNAPGKRRRNRTRGGQRPGSPSERERADAEDGGADDDRSAKGTEVEVDMERQAEVAVDFLTKLTAEFGLAASIAVHRPDEDTVEVQLSGPDPGILIGPKGATLVAVQSLTRTVVFNETGGTNGHINVDVGGYRQKRTEALVRFAHQVAEQVLSSGNRTALEPMSAVDRKIVHDTISDIDGVSTVSEGEEPRRRVVVLPG